jgi:thioesterase domain-containing protein
VGLHCVRLARYLGEDRAFYALQPVGPQDPSLPATIQAMAASYLKTLRSIEPRGPYLLGGFCNGGLTAFEIAQQLRAEGESVGFLLVVDSIARNTRHRIQHKMVHLTARVLGLQPARELDCFLRVRNFVNGFNESPGLERIAFVLRKLLKLKKAAKFLPGVFGFEPSEATRLSEDTARWNWSASLTAKDRHYTRLLAGYVTYPYPGRVTLFRSSDPNESTDPALGWRDVCSDVEVHLIPGDHSSCVDDPKNLEVLAQRLKCCLKNL